MRLKYSEELIVLASYQLMEAQDAAELMTFLVLHSKLR
jgi:hypothetical protein